MSIKRDHKEIQELVSEVISEKDSLIAEKESIINKQAQTISEFESKSGTFQNARTRRFSQKEFLKSLDRSKEVEVSFALKSLRTNNSQGKKSSIA